MNRSEWDNIPQAFNDWWNADYNDSSNPFRLNSAAYWAWAGWQAAKQAEQQEPEAYLYKYTRPDGSTYLSTVLHDRYPHQEVGVYTHPAPQQADRQRVPDGWKLVPVEPTPEMLEAAHDAIQSEGLTTTTWLRTTCYRAMLAAAPQPSAEPVADKLGGEWVPCVKLPVVVHVRNQRQGEQHISTREGITPVKPDDLIMRGVAGEEYPIGRELWEKTYTTDLAQPVIDKSAATRIATTLGWEPPRERLGETK